MSVHCNQNEEPCYEDISEPSPVNSPPEASHIESNEGPVESIKSSTTEGEVQGLKIFYRTKAFVKDALRAQRIYSVEKEKMENTTKTCTTNLERKSFLIEKLHGRVSIQDGADSAVDCGSVLPNDNEKHPSRVHLCNKSIEDPVEKANMSQCVNKPISDSRSAGIINLVDVDAEYGCLDRSSAGKALSFSGLKNSEKSVRVPVVSDKSLDNEVDNDVSADDFLLISSSKNPSEGEANSDVNKAKDISLPDRKMARAKKSCHTIKPKNPKESIIDLTLSTSNTSLTSPISPQSGVSKSIAKMSPVKSGRARISFSYASFKLPSLENRLGLSVKSFSELDAKTLDKIIMMKTTNMGKKDGTGNQASTSGHGSSAHHGAGNSGVETDAATDQSCDEMTNDQPMGRSASSRNRDTITQGDEDATNDDPTRQIEEVTSITGKNGVKSKARKSSHCVTVGGSSQSNQTLHVNGTSDSSEAIVVQRLNGSEGEGRVTARKAISVKRGCDEMEESQPVKRFRSRVGDKKERFDEGPALVPESLYNVTPPTTPTDSADSSDHTASVIGEESLNPRRYSTSTCCCKDDGISLKSFAAITVNCQAIDSVDGKAIGCSTRVRNKVLFRVSHRIPFGVLCEAHHQRLTEHKCCPICGLFCTQGEFVQCSSGTCQHTCHSQCLSLNNGRYYCPHCAQEISLITTLLRQLNTQPPSLYALPPSEQQHINSLSLDGSVNARFISPITQRDFRKPVCDASTASGSVASSHCNNDLLSVGLSVSERATVQAIMNGEKVKKARLCVKSLFTACRTGDLERVALLLSEGLDPNITPDDVPYSAIHAAAKHGHDGILELLIRFGANENARDSDLRTPLMYAAEAGQYRTVKYLLHTRASTALKGVDGMTSLHLAAKSGYCAVVQLLVETERFNVNAKDEGGWTPLVWATEHGHNDTVKYLLKCGAQPHLSDVELNTCLHWAAYSGHAEVAELYLNAGCSVNCPNENGDSPLHISVRREHADCVALLLRYGADVMSVNKANETPLMCCRDEGSIIYSLLKNHSVTYGRAPQRVLNSDISRGRENFCISVVNGVDDEKFPEDFLYVSDHVETFPLNVNRSVSSLSACKCLVDCGMPTCTCSRQSVKCPYDKLGRLRNDFNFADPPLIFECNRACLCHSTCPNRVVQMGITCRLEVFRTNGRGWGCRTLQDIPQGTFVCEYFGELISDAEAERRVDDSYLFDLDSQCQDTDTFCIDAKHYGNVSRFINHLCEPNLIPLKIFVDHHDLRFPRMCFFATRDIKENQELGFDYGDRFWSIKWKQFTCKCRSPSCRYSSERIRQTLEEYNRRVREDDEEEDTSNPN